LSMYIWVVCFCNCTCTCGWLFVCFLYIMSCVWILFFVFSKMFRISHSDMPDKLKPDTFESDLKKVSDSLDQSLVEVLTSYWVELFYELNSSHNSINSEYLWVAATRYVKWHHKPLAFYSDANWVLIVTESTKLELFASFYKDFSNWQRVRPSGLSFGGESEPEEEI